MNVTAIKIVIETKVVTQETEVGEIETQAVQIAPLNTSRWVVKKRNH